MNNLDSIIKQNPYRAYMYSYPHKTAYYKLKTVSLKNKWQKENKNSLFLYMHIPFCLKKCGFCNLLSTDDFHNNLMNQYIKTMNIQAEAVKEILGSFSFSRFAIGGGTPTSLSENQIESILNIAEKSFNINLKKIPLSIELSPVSVSMPKLKLLKQKNTSRISIGLQSFNTAENKILNRYQKSRHVIKVLENIKKLDFPILNLDLIFGIPGQTRKSLLYSLKKALIFSPEELYLYPFYYRDHTLLAELNPGIKNAVEQEKILEYYEIARNFLFSNGYLQSSMRMFYKKNVNRKNKNKYSCQEDGMISLGCGARSYTKDLHYSSEYSISKNGIKKIIHNYLTKSKKSFYYADYGFELNTDEQKRRFIIKSILKKEGLNKKKYLKIFKSDAENDFTIINTLIKLKYMRSGSKNIYLTDKGIAYSDSIGPLFISKKVRKRMESYIFK